MRVRIPEELEGYKHDDIVEAIKELNPQLEIPSKTSWKQGLPDLEEPLSHIAVEIELTSLHTGWGQCLIYYRQGSPEIHLILSPHLYEGYVQKEQAFVNENPIPNVVVYELSQIPKPFRPKTPRPEPEEEEEEKQVKRIRKKKPVVSELSSKWDKMVLLSKGSNLYMKIMAEARVCDESVYLSQHGEGWSTSVRVGILVGGGMRFNRINYGFIRPTGFKTISEQLPQPDPEFYQLSERSTDVEKIGLALRERFRK